MKKTILILTYSLLTISIIACSSEDNPESNDPTPENKTFLTQLSTSSLNFPDTQLNASENLTFSIDNKGNQIINVTSLSLPTGFTINPSNSNIAVGGNQIFTITFTPTEIKTYGGTITITSNSTSSEKTINCTGKGIAAPPTTYTNNIKAIINLGCATANCHDSTNPASNIPLTNFTEVKAAFISNGAWAEIQSGRMPKTGSLTQNEKNLIESWVNGNYIE